MNGTSRIAAARRRRGEVFWGGSRDPRGGGLFGSCVLAGEPIGGSSSRGEPIGGVVSVGKPMVGCRAQDGTAMSMEDVLVGVEKAVLCMSLLEKENRGGADVVCQGSS